MTPQENQQLTHFLKQLAEARVVEKDSEAEALISETVARQPDAAYLLVQRALLVEQALDAAKAQIAQLQGQLQNAQKTQRNTGFLGGGNPWSQSLDSPSDRAGVPGASTYQIPRGVNMANTAPVSTGGAGSFLGNMATTAAGVVAGSFLFQGIEHLLGHQQSASWGSGDSPGERLTEQTIINNYYDTQPGEGLTDKADWPDAHHAGEFLASDAAEEDFDDGGESGWV